MPETLEIETTLGQGAETILETEKEPSGIVIEMTSGIGSERDMTLGIEKTPEKQDLEGMNEPQKQKCINNHFWWF